MQEAEALGIVACASCGHPRNNHWENGKKYCAHCLVWRAGPNEHIRMCKGFKASFRYGVKLGKA
jgi:hypothetical protein